MRHGLMVRMCAVLVALKWSVRADGNINMTHETWKLKSPVTHDPLIPGYVTAVRRKLYHSPMLLRLIYGSGRLPFEIFRNQTPGSPSQKLVKYTHVWYRSIFIGL